MDDRPRRPGAVASQVSAASTVNVARHTASIARAWLDADAPVAAGVLVAVEGSAPFDPGATMFVGADGAIEGSVTGGCVEGAVAQEALALLADPSRAPAHVLTYGISDELAGTVGLTCGGLVQILVQRLDGEARRVARAGLDAIADGRPAAIATVLDGERAGASLVVDGDERTGSLGPALLDDNVEREARGLLAQGTSTIRRFGADGATLGDDVRVFVAAHAEPPSMVLFGAGDFAAALAPLAGRLGYRVEIRDPRSAFLASERLTAHAEVSAGWPGEALAGRTLGPRDAVLVLSHDPKLDVPALLAAFGTDAGYIGALGSRRTTADREHRLREAGAGDDDLARLLAPCGLDIGSTTPEEVAVSILAEIIARRAGRRGRPLRDGAGPIRHGHDAEDGRDA